MTEFTNGIFTITDLEYGINDYAIVKDYGQAPIVFDLDIPENTYVLINDEKYPLNGFMRIEEA